MIIAVNTRFLLADQLEGYGHFLNETLQRIVRGHPEHQFIFLFDRPFDQRFVFADNVTPVVVGPAARHPLLWKWWYDFRVPAILKKHRADVFVSFDGFASLRTRVPQCLLIHDLAFLHQPEGIHRSHLAFYKKYTKRFALKAKQLATVSAFSKNDISTAYGIDPASISVIYNAPREIFKPLAEEERNAIRNEYCDGRNFFLYTGSIHPRKNLIQLLKAFSIFKKRQKSDWKLILAGRLAWKNNHFLEQVRAYKYREDVIMTGYLEEKELARLTASAYALVYPSLFEGFGMPVVEAMASGTPVITSINSAMQEIAGDAALYSDPLDHKSIADNMMLVYKDETLRDELIRKGAERIKLYSWDKTATQLYNFILKATKH